jgi:hypothetical protein
MHVAVHDDGSNLEATATNGGWTWALTVCGACCWR